MNAPQVQVEDQSVARAMQEMGAGMLVQTQNTNIGARYVQKPRDLKEVMAEIQVTAELLGDKWEYALPFKKFNRDTGKSETTFVRGPTIGCTLDIARAYGNCSLDITRVEKEADAWLFYATFLDIEKGFQITRVFRQRMDQNIGGMGGDKGRVLDNLVQIGVSKALRNVVRNALRGIVDRGVEMARDRLADKIGKNLDSYRNRVIERLDEYNIPQKEAEAYFGQKIDAMPAPRIAQLIRMLQSVAEGNVRSVDLFNPAEIEIDAEVVDGPPTPSRQKQTPAPKKRGRPVKVDQAEHADPETGEVTTDQPEQQSEKKAPATQLADDLDENLFGD